MTCHRCSHNGDYMLDVFCVCVCPLSICLMMGICLAQLASECWCAVNICITRSMHLDHCFFPYEKIVCPGWLLRWVCKNLEHLPNTRYVLLICMQPDNFYAQVSVATDQTCSVLLMATRCVLLLATHQWSVAVQGL